MRQLRLGCIADDFTGATDLANNLVRGGMRTVVTIGVPDQDQTIDADAIVVALKTRTAPVHNAVALSLRACLALQQRGARQIYFKICSTFDSTPQGNIGPVLEELMRQLACRFSVVAPAFPENGRTVYLSHLFVNGRLLAESSMRHHPLTPMTESNLVRVLLPQLSIETRRVGQLPAAGSVEELRHSVEELTAADVAIAIADATTGKDMERLAAVLCEAALVTASSGLAIYLPGQWGFSPTDEAARLPQPRGRAAILAGSCSEATNRQVQHFIETGGAGWRLDVTDLVADPDRALVRALHWAEQQWQRDPEQPLLLYSTTDGDAVRRSQTGFAPGEVGSHVERWMGELALALTQRGVRRLVVAGGETSGACVQALDVPRLHVGVQIDPGVPWCYADRAGEAPEGLHLALKSGNFGADDFFRKAIAMLAGSSGAEAGI